MSWDGSHVTILWIQKNCMFGALAMENTAFLYKVANEVTALHLTTLELGSFASEFSQLLPYPPVPADFPVRAEPPLLDFPLPL